MEAGYWGNYETGSIFLIDDHELWIRRDCNAEKLGIAPEVIAKFGEFPDRASLLRFLFANAPVIRFRGHGPFVTFEFESHDWEKPLKLIETWCQANAGPFLGLNMFNFHRTERRFVLWKDFETAKI